MEILRSRSGISHGGSCEKSLDHNTLESIAQLKSDLAKKDREVEELRKTVQTLMATQGTVTDVSKLNENYIQTSTINQTTSKLKSAPEIKDQMKQLIQNLQASKTKGGFFQDVTFSLGYLGKRSKYF